MKVTLYSASGTVLATTLTDSNGTYMFTNLVSGDYSVGFDKATLPANYVFTARNATGAINNDSDADILSGRTVVTHLDAGEVDLSWDAGIFTTAATTVATTTTTVLPVPPVVTPAPVPMPVATKPVYTGAEPTPLVALGALLVALGTVLVALRRRHQAGTIIH